MSDDSGDDVPSLSDNPYRSTTIQAPSLFGDDTPVPLEDVRVGFQSGFVFEIFDSSPGVGVTDTFVLVLNPSVYSLGEPQQSTLTPAEDNTVVAEENGIITRNITIEGTFGISQKKATGFLGAQGNGQALSGNQHFLSLRNLFRKYSRLKKAATGSENIQLHFHSLRENDHFVVVPLAFEMPRDAKATRIHYEYRIQCTAIAVVDGSTLRTITDPAAFNTAARDIGQAFHDARAYFADINQQIVSIRRQVQNITAVMQQAAGLINLVGNFVNGSEDLIQSPLKAFAAGAESIRDAGETLSASLATVPSSPQAIIDLASERSLRRLESCFDTILAYKDKFAPPVGDNLLAPFSGERALTQQDVLDGTAGATIGSRTRVSLGSAGSAGLNLAGYTSTRPVVVARTDTVDSIGARFAVPPEAIVLINDLRPPYIAEGGGPGILAPGDTLLVPVVSGGPVQSTQANVGEYLTAEDLLYGVDLALDPALLAQGTLEWEIDTTHGSTDASLIRGAGNVVQGTWITVNTERGATVFLPDVGLRRNAGIKGTIAQVLLAALALREGILTDTRVQSIQSERIVLSGDVLTQEITPIIRGGLAGPPLVIPFATAAGAGA